MATLLVSITQQQGHQNQPGRIKDEIPQEI
jgi:hypothetical protein